MRGAVPNGVVSEDLTEKGGLNKDLKGCGGVSPTVNWGKGEGDSP